MAKLAAWFCTSTSRDAQGDLTVRLDGDRGVLRHQHE
jgi:hypothetical protein